MSFLAIFFGLIIGLVGFVVLNLAIVLFKLALRGLANGVIFLICLPEFLGFKKY